jgi:hypothetical protein
MQWYARSPHLVPYFVVVAAVVTLAVVGVAVDNQAAENPTIGLTACQKQGLEEIVGKNH